MSEDKRTRAERQYDDAHKMVTAMGAELQRNADAADRLRAERDQILKHWTWKMIGVRRAQLRLTKLFRSEQLLHAIEIEDNAIASETLIREYINRIMAELERLAKESRPQPKPVEVHDVTEAAEGPSGLVTEGDPR